MRHNLVWCLPLTLVFACGQPGDSNGDPNPTPSDQTIVMDNGGYEVPAHSEFYRCWRVNVDGQNRGLTRIEYAPGSNAVHHVLIGIDTNPDPEGVGPCNLVEQDWQVMFAGGIESDPLTVPDGVAFDLGSGTKQIFLQIHYFNPFDEPIMDHTVGTLTTTKANAVFELAGLLFTGSFDFSIPPGASDYPVWGECTIPANSGPWNIFAVFPHMHQFGTHITLTRAQAAGGTDTLFDGAWTFGEQPIKAVSAALTQGDTLRTDCVYNNPTSDSVSYGESSTEEMCFGFFYYSPAPTSSMLPCITADGEG